MYPAGAIDLGEVVYGDANGQISGFSLMGSGVIAPSIWGSQVPCLGGGGGGGGRRGGR